MKLIVKHISIITYPIPVITRYTHNLPPVASKFWATRWIQGHSLIGEALEVGSEGPLIC